MISDLHWKQEKETFYKNFESLLTEEEELLNFYLPKEAFSDHGSNSGSIFGLDISLIYS